MAKLKDLAGLAALGMLGYKLSKGKGDSSGMTGAQNDTLADVNKISKLSDESNTLARVNRENTPGQGAINDTNAGVLNALSAPKAAPNDKAPSQGVLPSKSLTPEVKPKPKPKAPVMSSAQNTALANAGKQAKMAAENDALAKANQGMGKTASPKMLPGSDPFEIFKSGKPHPRTGRPMKNGGAVKKMASGGMTASSRADGIASRGKTRCKMY